MSETPNKILIAAITKVLTPLVRILLRNGVSFGVFSDIAKWVYVDVANKDFGVPFKKQTDSRISVITGLNRKDVNKVKKMEKPDSGVVTEKYNRAARVISGWVRDVEFANEEGTPAVLELEGRTGSFAALVKRYSGDVPARAILDELVNTGSVEMVNGSKVQLNARAYTPSDSEDEKLALMGEDASDLLSTFDHNLSNPAENSRLQLAAVYDNLPSEVIQRFHHLCKTRGQQFLEDMDQWMAQHDRDANPKAKKGTGRKRAGIGIYFFENEEEEEAK